MVRPMVTELERAANNVVVVIPADEETEEMTEEETESETGESTSEETTEDIAEDTADDGAEEDTTIPEQKNDKKSQK